MNALFALGWWFAAATLPAVPDPTACIVLITTDVARGTGFVCAFNGTNYIITNTHVLEGAQKFEFRTINNTALNAVRIELANDRDLARVLISDTRAPARHLAADAPQIGQEIAALGNSEGAGVVTQLKGAIRGVGPDVIEVDAPFVSGNSGSPIVTTAGEVLGVATFVTKPGLATWMTKGTPFAQARRFAVRLQGPIDWRPVTPRKLYAESTTLLDCDRFVEDCVVLAAILRDKQWDKFPLLTARQREGHSARYADAEYSRTIIRFCENLKSAEEAYKRTGNVGSGSVSLALRSAEIQFRQLPQLPLGKLRQTRWTTKHFQESARKYETLFASEKWDLSFNRH